MRAAVTCEHLDIELEIVRGGINIQANSGDYESAIGCMTLVEAEELRTALDILISAAKH